MYPQMDTGRRPVIDLVYPLKRGASQWADNEIRYSLRSVAENLRLPVRDVYLVGDKPGFLDVAHIPMEDHFEKSIALMQKYRAACESDEVSDPFLLLDDDHIFLRETSEIPLMAGGMLGKLMQRQWFQQRKRYGAYLYNCLVLLRRHKLPERNYQIHYPMLIHKEPMREVLRMAEGVGTVMGSLYGNLVREPTVETPIDFRVNSAKAWDFVKNGPFMSIEERLKHVDAQNGALRIIRVEPFLRRRFPGPSRWEV